MPVDHKNRGKIGNEEKEKILKKTGFTTLTKDEREAFFRYQCDDRYPEDKDICDISPNAVGMDIKSRRYQFWLQCEQLERFSTLLEAYVTGEDDMRLPEVDQCFNESRSSSGEQELETFLKKRTDVENTKSFISDLKSKMYDEITTDFERYKKNIEEQLKKK